MYPGSPARERHDPLPIRRRNTSVDSSEMRKRRRGSSPVGSMEPSIPRRSSSSRGGGGGDYGNGYSASAAPTTRSTGSPAAAGQNSKTRRLYIGGLPPNVGLTDVALRQFFSALYVAGFKQLQPDEVLPVLSAWLHHDGKFGFLELRGDQEAVNMMVFHGLELHRRPLRISRPSDYKSEEHPEVADLTPDAVNFSAVVELVDQLNGIVKIPDDVLTSMQSSSQNAKKREDIKNEMTLTPAGNGTNRAAEYSPKPGQTNGHTTNVDTKSEMSIESKSDRADNSTRVPGNAGTGEKTGNGGRNVGGNVISLVNMLKSEELEGPDDEYEDLVDDVKSECEQYGEVRSVNMPRDGPWKGTAFIEFTRKEHAEVAVKELGKRVFDNRLIIAEVVAGCATTAEAAARASPGTR